MADKGLHQQQLDEILSLKKGHDDIDFVLKHHIKIYDRGTKVMYIPRGLPGCGKSTFCRKMTEILLGLKGITILCDPEKATQEGFLHLYQNYILSTDDYFTIVGEDGHLKYKFNPSKVRQAHEYNKARAENSARLGISPLFIDNTNIKKIEFEPYIKIATNYGYKVVVVEPEHFYTSGNPWQQWIKDPQVLFEQRNPKNIPLEALQRMAVSYEQY